MTNGKLLDDIIRQSGLKKGFLAEKVGLSRVTFSARLRNASEFRASQIKVLCELLDIRDDETVKAIFFGPSGA